MRKASEFPHLNTWNTFCNLPCRAVLDRCGHLCKLECHSPIDIKHNTKCVEQLDRPCETHKEVQLLCHELVIPLYYRINSIKPNEKLKRALLGFKCKVKVEYSRPECDHIVQIACHYKNEILNNTSSLKACEEIVSDYIHPVCNHSFSKPKCITKREYETAPPRCIRMVPHKRPCGCETSMQCHERIEELKRPSICQSSKNINRPRCGHILSMRCYQAERLIADWNGQNGKSAFDGSLFFFI